MKALQLQALYRLELVEVAPPSIRDDELLVKTGASTICTSDLNDIRENPFGIALPVVIGHEAAGTVVEVGARVRGFRAGDRVATHPVHPCGVCAACRSGLGHLCLNMAHFGINMPGTFAEYYVVRADRARVIPGTVDFPLGALAEPVCVCLEALDQARLAPGDALLIIGDGPFGVMMARLAAALDLGRVVIAGWFDFRLSFAGDAAKVNTKDRPDRVEAMLRATAGAGYDAVILAVGSAQAAADGIRCLKPRGRLVVFAALTGTTPIDLFAVHLKELAIVGACNDQDKLDPAIEMLADQRLGLGDLITHRFAIEDYQKAFALAALGKAEALKTAIVF